LRLEAYAFESSVQSRYLFILPRLSAQRNSFLALAGTGSWGDREPLPNGGSEPLIGGWTGSKFILHNRIRISFARIN